MNRKSFGKAAFGFAVVAAFLLVSCAETIPGDPQGTLKRYITAVQEDDFKTLYELNRSTAQQRKHLERTTIGDVEGMLEASYRERKKAYDEHPRDLTINVQWAEKNYFPPSSAVVYGKPNHPPAAGDDPVNAEYERANNVNVPVTVTYHDKNEALQIGGVTVREIAFVCALTKIREGKNVRIYSHDDQWFFGSCIPEQQSIKSFE